jgi:hypothetical protein
LPFFRENNVHTFFSSSRYIILPKNFFSDFAQGLLKSHYFEQNLILGTKKSEKKKKTEKKNWLRSNFKLLAFFMRGISTTTYLLFQCKKREKNFNFTKKNVFVFFLAKTVDAAPFF